METGEAQVQLWIERQSLYLNGVFPLYRCTLYVVVSLQLYLNVAWLPTLTLLLCSFINSNTFTPFII